MTALEVIQEIKNCISSKLVQLSARIADVGGVAISTAGSAAPTIGAATLLLLVLLLVIPELVILLLLPLALVLMVLAMAWILLILLLVVVVDGTGGTGFQN